MNQTIVVGGPGTGKTSRLLEILEGILRNYEPKDIAFLGFTRKAAYEARDRAIEKFAGFDLDEFRYFRTIHSLAFQSLQIDRDQVLKKKQYVELFSTLGIDYRGSIDEYGISLGSSEGDKISRLEQLCRTTKKDLKEEAAKVEINPWKADRYSRALQDYKRELGLIDFVDMIDMFIDRKPIDRIPVVFVDEGQDLSPIHWRAVQYLIERSDANFIGGDDDQAIFKWAGADVETFLSLVGRREVLPLSHRLPAQIFDLANSISSRIKSRIPKDWASTSRIGEIHRRESVDNVDLDSGDWLLLCRHGFQLREYIASCRARGYLYSVKGSSSVNTPEVAALMDYEDIRRRRPIEAKRLQSLGKYCRFLFDDRFAKLESELPEAIVKAEDFGLKYRELPPWFEILIMSKREKNYLRDALRRLSREGQRDLRGALSQSPRINISTIHGVKGGEAENVVLGLDLSPAAFHEYEKPRTSDNEHRVFYVGATRAKERLFLVEPKTQRRYPL